ncbi:MAG TPA: helicase-associated domain-containing protein [Candidatus Limnocylindria bacterium]|nr:helicase-associated domain-containing protein [Candidatus Limnocylindria bacterium]
MEASPTSYALRLSALPPEDVVTLLTRRPDAAAVAGQRTVTWGALASALATPRGVHDALGGLNRFLDRVLQLACVYGGRLTRSQASAEGLAGEHLARAAAELRRWGLAFPEPDGTLVVPGAVTSQVWCPAGLGYHATVLLEHRTVEDLRTIATALGVPQPSKPPMRKRDLLHGVAQRLADRDAVRALVAGAPAKARAALEELRAGGGTSQGTPAASLWQRRYEWNDRWGPRREPADGPSWLLAHGLVLPNDEWGSLVSVPLEVEHALRGRVFGSWPADPPPLPLVALRDERQPAQLVAEMSALLDAWRHEPPPALQNGGVPKRELKRAAQALGCTEEWAAELAGLALSAGLLSAREVVPEERSRSYRHPRVLRSRQAVIEVCVDEWDALDGAERWLRLVRAWSARVADPMANGPHGPRNWRLLLALLAELPEGRGADAAHLGALVAWRHPAAFPDDAAAARFAALVGSTLRALGAGGAEPAIGLASLGRAVLLHDGPIDTAALRTSFPAPVDTCTVTADHRVIVAGTPAGALAALLTLVADLVSVHPAHVYRLSDVSLRRALDAGWTAARVLEALRGRAPGGIPQNVVALVEDTARRHGRLRVGAAAQYVVADDSAQLEQLLRSRAGRSLGLRRIAPTVAVAEAKSVRHVLGTLRTAGLMPVADGTGEPGAAATTVPRAPRRDARAKAARAATPEPPRGLGLLGVERALDRGEAEALAARLRAAPKAVMDAVDPRHEPVREVLATAAREHESVEIEYRASAVAAPLRLLIQPYYVSGNYIEAYDRGRMRRFDVRCVVWAERATEGDRVGMPLWS